LNAKVTPDPAAYFMLHLLVCTFKTYYTFREKWMYCTLNLKITFCCISLTG